jgi:hypothetical protein
MHTTLIKLKAYYGFTKPYEFKYAIPFLSNLLVLCFTLVLAGYWIAAGKLDLGTVRFYFVAYLVLASIGAALAARKTLISFAVFIWIAFDIFIAFATYIGGQYQLTPSLMPHNTNIFSRFEYHPLLQGTPKKNFVQGGKVKIRHNTRGMRGGELIHKHNIIHVYGGSSTYDVANGEGNTWVEKLQAELGDGFAAYNFGVPGYTSAEHVIQTVFYGDVDGVYPKCAVYYMGWNDIRNSHIPNVDPAYADFHLLSQVNGLQVRNPPIVDFSPLLGIVLKFAKSLVDTIPHPTNHRGIATYSGLDERLGRIYANNIETLSAVNRSRGVKTVFIGQLLDKWALTSDRPYGWLPYVADKDLWSTQIIFNLILEKKSGLLNDLYIEVNVDGFQQEDFHDQGHFSSSGAEKFALAIAPKIDQYCR